MSLKATIIKTFPNSEFAEHELSVLREIAEIVSRCCGESHQSKLEGRLVLSYQPKTDPDFTTKATEILAFDLSRNGRLINVPSEPCRLQPVEAERGRYRFGWFSDRTETDETALGMLIAALADTLTILRPDDQLLFEQAKTYRAKQSVLIDVQNLFSRAGASPTTPFRALRQWIELTQPTSF